MTTLRLPKDEALTWWLQCGEAVLGRASTFREGGGGSGDADHERRITDRLYGLGPTTRRDATKARELGARWHRLEPMHRDVLALAYGVGPLRLREQVTDATNLEAWQAMERVFGQYAAVALYLAESVSDPHVRPGVGGPWRTPEAKHLLALAAANEQGTKEKPGPARVAAQNAVAAVTVALEVWWGTEVR